MLVGIITLGTGYGDADIPVELLGKGPRPGTAWVRALGGLQPFTKISHGGPCPDDTTLIPLPFLRDVHLERDTDEEQGEEFNVQPNTLALDWFLESAYTVCAQRPGGREA